MVATLLLLYNDDNDNDDNNDDNDKDCGEQELV